MVIFRDGDGKPGYHQVEELAEAIEHVEHLRNDEGVEHARIFQMEEVAFEFRPYFRVEVGSAAAAPQSQPAPPTSSWAAQVDAAPAPAPVVLAAVEPQPLGAALIAIVGEPAGEPWPEHESAPAAHTGDDGLSANGARRGLFGR